MAGVGKGPAAPVVSGLCRSDDEGPADCCDGPILTRPAAGIRPRLLCAICGQGVVADSTCGFLSASRRRKRLAGSRRLTLSHDGHLAGGGKLASPALLAGWMAVLPGNSGTDARS